MRFELRFTTNSVSLGDDITAYEALGFVYNDKTNSYDGDPTIEVNTMEEFEKILEICGDVVITMPRGGADYAIEIYNDYRE